MPQPRWNTDRRPSAGARHDYIQPRPYTVTQSTANTEPDLLPDADVTEGLLPEPLQTLSIPTTSSTDEDPSVPLKLENFTCIGSYNWMDSPHPTILVPGSPRIWRDRPLPFHVPLDEGFQIFDPNGYHMGSSASSPLIPIFRAVDVVAEDNADTTMDWPAVDIVADRSSLRKLLRWIKHADKSRTDATPGRGSLQGFRIDLQLGGKKTVLMQRWDTRTCQYATPPFHGCRKNFEKAATTSAPECEPASDHNRIVQYDLDGLRMVVRFEVDARICTGSDSDTAKDGLSELLEGLSIAPKVPNAEPNTPPTPPIPDATSIVTVVRGGTQLPQSAIVEITTRSVKGAEHHSWEETYTQLFLSQTPRHFLAIHRGGTFASVSKRPLNSPHFTRIAAGERMRRHLRMLVGVLREIQRLTRAHGGRGRLSLVCRDARLELFQRGNGSDTGCVPDEELARFGI
ncbi:hypothetical protein C8Q80DRAFT_1113204 [Daedaleopsis nitida]|nr:hypothetical protein C8Q80DRAFT_1113204 [Daedaleopsis nitida]